MATKSNNMKSLQQLCMKKIVDVTNYFSLELLDDTLPISIVDEIIEVAEVALCAPIKKENGYKGCLGTFNLDILDEFDPTIQLKSLERQETALLSQALKKHKSIKFITNLDIEFVKYGEESKLMTFQFMPYFVSLTSKDGIPEARCLMHQRINKKIDRITNQGLVWIKNTRHFMIIRKDTPFYNKELKKTNHKGFKIDKMLRKKKINGVEHAFVKRLGWRRI